MYAPLMPFITAQIYQDLYKDQEGIKSIHISTWTKVFQFDVSLDIQDFNQVVAAIDEVRKYKALQNMSLGKELESYNLTSSIDLAKYGDLVRGVGRIRILNNKF